MILAFAAKGKKTIAYTMLALMYFETIIPSYALGASRITYPRIVLPVDKKGTTATVVKPAAIKKIEGGPTQPESQQFSSVNSDNMVDLFSGDFSYSIPLLDVGGYPLAIGYSSGITMDQEASWVGLGWNINPGAILRNMRGLPDDFNGQDSVRKVASIKENKTIGGSVGADVEFFSNQLNVSASLGLFHNTYRGWGLEKSVGASLTAAKNSSGSLTAGLSLANNSQDGFSITPSLSLKLSEVDVSEKAGFGGNLSTSLTYNTRSGLKALQYSAGITMYRTNEKATQNAQDVENKAAKKDGRAAGEVGSAIGHTSGVFSSYKSFAYPSFTPSMSLPYTSRMVSVTFKVGFELKTLHPNVFTSGYISKQTIADADTSMYYPAFGYLNYQNGARNPGSLLDYNREKDIVYREKPPLPNIAVPSYTFDVFNISGEGSGGSFRAYRGDIGYVYDHSMRTRDGSESYSGDVGFGDVVHIGVDFNYTRSFTQTGPWRVNNPLGSTVAFTNSDSTYEAVYFRNPGEKTINTRAFYDAIGGDDVVIPKLYQAGDNTPTIATTNYLTKFSNGEARTDIELTRQNAVKQARDKRTQVISYLTAKEASIVGNNLNIENYHLNKFLARSCKTTFNKDLESDSNGLVGRFYKGNDYKNYQFARIDTLVNFSSIGAMFQNRTDKLSDHFSAVWTGRLKAPISGIYNIAISSDDNICLTINDSIFLQTTGKIGNTIRTVNLEKGQFYDIKINYYNGPGGGYLNMKWMCDTVALTAKDFFLPTSKDAYEALDDTLTMEERINSFRKPNHISEVTVLNADGQRYIYGLPVYNLKQKEVTFAAKHENGNAEENSVSYNYGIDNTTRNQNGTDHYFSKEEMPAYAHSFLMTGVMSPDYIDLTGDGITDDDPGNAVRFNYTKTAGIANPYKWKTPYSADANYNEGLRSDNRDDKGSYVYGEKELWYLNAIESKNMIAVFTLEDRQDLYPINEKGDKELVNPAKRLKEINLYTKADFIKNNTKARPVKTVHFEYTYELCKGVNLPVNNQGKLTLKKIWFSYNGNKKGLKNAYEFNYNQKNPDYDHKSFDRWGNYKNPADNPGYTTGNKITNAEYPYALQDSTKAAKNIAAWTLDSIKLPSGGRMKITYESDDYGYVQHHRATQMFKIAGFSKDIPTTGNLKNQLYEPYTTDNDNLYIAVNVPETVSSKKDVYNKYLAGLDTTVYFRLHVQMPSDKFGSGYEFIPSYAKLDSDSYGYINGNTIWFKVKGIDKKGEADGNFSPMGKAAAQFLRLNLPSKAYPGSDVGDDLDLVAGVQMLTSMTDNIKNMFNSYDVTARKNNWVRDVDLDRSFVRLNTPNYKKYGNGLRVKKILIYDNWNAMTGRKESIYGTDYKYTKIEKIDSVEREISSGVATYEPVLGGEENPLRVPIEYTEQVSALAPVTMGYVETPMGEGFYPSASVGYSKVTTRSIHTKNIRSANGYEETMFYTSYDYPTISEFSTLGKDTKRRYKPGLSNLLRINAKHHLVMSQGFKVELNDMNGKLLSKTTYDESGAVIASSTNYYHTDNQNAEIKHLNNTVLSMNAVGEIDTTAVIGKEMELMMDMREQRTSTNSLSVNGNVDIFTVGIAVMGIPIVIPIPSSEETLFRSAAAAKVITRHGILDRTETIEKGSKVVAYNLLYDGETGDVLLSATQNEFGDFVYQFNYPAAWIYEGMSGAYKNIGATLKNVNIKAGKIVSGIRKALIDSCFISGDEILIYARSKVTDDENCVVKDSVLATFSAPGKIWAVDANALKGGNADIYFMQEDGTPYTGNDVTMKVIRSGRKNLSQSAGNVTMLINPLVKTANGYQLIIDNNSKVISAGVVEYKQNWQVEDRKKQKIICAY